MAELGKTFSHNAGTSSNEKDVEQANENATPKGEREPFASTQETLKETRFRKIPSRARGGTKGSAAEALYRRIIE